MEHDTIELLKECNAGVKMGIATLDEVLPRVQNSQLRGVLEQGKHEHERLGQDTRLLLAQCGEGGKEPNAMAKSMSWLKTNVKLAAEPSDATVADLMTDGCNMGIKSLRRYLNQYESAQPQAKSLAQRLIAVEESMTQQLQQYL